jgi:uncharacterized membrane protein (UPF0182 family)
VISGNLLTLPVGGGLLYVQPVYVQSRGETSFPLLQKVLVSFGNKIAFESTLDGALDSLFGGDSGAVAGDGDLPATDDGGGGTSDTGGGTTTPDDGGTTAPTGDPAVMSALAAAQQALTDRDAALAAGDWAAYGVADQRLKDAIAQAIAASDN